MAATSSGAPKIPLEFMEKIEHLEVQVKLLWKRKNITCTPTLMTYHSPFTMEIRTTTLLETFTMP